MEIRILSVGKIKEKYLRDGIQEYAKRLSRYARISFTAVADEKTPDHAAEKINQQILDLEGERLLEKIRDTDYVIALAISGEMMDSVSLAGFLDGLGVHGKSNIVFVIGGSLGLSGKVLKRADRKISFSALTFPHQLMQLILLEQIYRCFRIIHKEPYHK